MEFKRHSCQPRIAELKILGSSVHLSEHGKVYRVLDSSVEPAKEIGEAPLASVRALTVPAHLMETIWRTIIPASMNPTGSADSGSHTTALETLLFLLETADPAFTQPVMTVLDLSPPTKIPQESNPLARILAKNNRPSALPRRCAWLNLDNESHGVRMAAGLRTHGHTQAKPLPVLEFKIPGGDGIVWDPHHLEVSESLQILCVQN